MSAGIVGNCMIPHSVLTLNKVLKFEGVGVLKIHDPPLSPRLIRFFLIDCGRKRNSSLFTIFFLFLYPFHLP